MKRVQITRSIVLEDIPSEVYSMVEESHSLLSDGLDPTYEEMYTLLDNKNYTLFFEKIKKFRSELARADIILEDCFNIIIGYTNYLTDVENMDTQDANPQENISDKEKTFEDMKKVLQEKVNLINRSDEKSKI